MLRAMPPYWAVEHRLSAILPTRERATNAKESGSAPWAADAGHALGRVGCTHDAQRTQQFVSRRVGAHHVRQPSDATAGRATLSNPRHNLCRAADRDAVHAQRGLTDADRHALAVLAAGADARVELEVIADHHGALHRCADPSILDPVGFGALEHILARSDVHLSAAEIDRIDSILHRGDDLVRAVAAVEHIGIGHARHGHMCVALAAAIAGRAHVHEAGILSILHVAHKNTVL